jgi:Membrane domain of glycerophosphoryl diester phosphodiesterase
MKQVIEAGTIFGRATEMMKAGPREALLAVIVLTAVSVATDFMGLNTIILVAAVSLWFQTSVTQSVMNRHDLIADGEFRSGRFAAVFGVSFISNLAIILGFVLLVVPGIFLAVRWSIAVPAVVGSADSVTDGLRESWQKTKGQFWQILVVVLILTLFFMLPVAAALWFTDTAAGESAPFSLGINLVSSSGSVLGWYVMIALYEVLRSPRESLSEIFS